MYNNSFDYFIIISMLIIFSININFAYIILKFILACFTNKIDDFIDDIKEKLIKKCPIL